VHIGVGKSINYVESLNAATTIMGEIKNCIRTPIIPNSQIIVYGEVIEAKNWEAALIIEPDKNLQNILAGTLVTLIVIGIAIITLHIQER